MPSCFRCQTTNPLLNQNGDRCTACAHPFVRSFASFGFGFGLGLP